MAVHSVDAEAALHRLAERRPDWSSVSSYDSEDELYIQYERPGDVTSFPALLAPFEDDQERKNIGTEELNPGSIVSAPQSILLDDSSAESCEETDPYGYYSLGSGVVWSHLSNMDAPGSTKFLEGDATEEKDGCTEDSLTENECSPFDEIPAYLNPSLFPDLNTDGDDDDSPSSMLTEHTLTDQIDRLRLLAKQEANPSPTSLCSSVNPFDGFRADLELNLKGYCAECHDFMQNAQNQGERDPMGFQTFNDNLMKGPDEMRDVKHEFNDPDRAFNAAKLPKFNSNPSPALKNLIEIQGRVWKEASPGPTVVEKENKTSSPGTSGHLRRKKLPGNMIGRSSSKSQNRHDQTSPGKKGVWWANDVEYIEKFSPTSTEKSNESKRKKSRSKLSLSIPKEPASKQLPYRLRKPSDTESYPDDVTEFGEW